MRDENLLSIASKLSDFSSDLLILISEQDDKPLQLMSLYHMMENEGAGLQKTQGAISCLKMALLINVQRKDRRTSNVTLSEYGKRLMDISQSEDIQRMKPDPLLPDYALQQINLIMEPEGEEVLRLLAKKGDCRLLDLYEHHFNHISKRVFYSRIAALEAALLIQSRSKRKRLYLTSNGSRFLKILSKNQKRRIVSVS